MQCRNLGDTEKEQQRRHTLKLVGHNVVFDVRHLNGALEYCQAKMGEHRIWQSVKMEDTFDTQTYYRNVLGNRASYSLDAMCAKYGIRTDSRKYAHGALVDALVTARCLQQMWR